MGKRAFASLALLVITVPGIGCGSASGPGSDPGSKACSLETRVGGFAVQLVEPTQDTPGYTAIGGGILNGITPTDVWPQEGPTSGGCLMRVGPGLSCSPECPVSQICAGNNQCADKPTYQDAGPITFTGLGPTDVVEDPVQGTYSDSVAAPYPPFAPGATVGLQSAGATVPMFALAGQGIEPLIFDATGVTLVGGQALAFTWTPPTQVGGAARIFVKLEIGHHGGVAARVECDLPDTGSGQIPASVVSALVAKGIHGFPTLALTRRTIDSTTLAGGCVDFAVASPVERGITACRTPGDCVTSCNTNDQCTAPETCQVDFTCG